MKEERVKIKFNFIVALLKGAWQGKTPARVFMNYCLNGQELKGNVIDLGSGGGKGSYYASFRFKEPYFLCQVDNFRKGPDTVALDLEHPLSLKSNFYDYVLCFNLLELIYNYEQLISESFRILAPGGNYLTFVPFLRQVHFDPHDYFRFTGEALEKIYEGAGFQIQKLTAVGTGPFLAAYDLVTALMPVNIFFNFIRVCFIIPALILDFLVSKWKPQVADKYVLGYFLKLKK